MKKYKALYEWNKRKNEYIAAGCTPFNAGVLSSLIALFTTAWLVVSAYIASLLSGIFWVISVIVILTSVFLIPNLINMLHNRLDEAFKRICS